VIPAPNDRRRDLRPPRLASWLLSLTTAARNNQFALGDLEEEFQEIADTPAGLRGARRLYWQQVWRCLLHPGAPEHLESEPPGKRGATMLDAILQDARYGARTLIKAPGFAMVAVLTLALAIGATTAIFSVTDAVVLRPLPFRDPQQLVAVWETNRAEGNQVWRVAPANYVDWRAQADAFADVAAFGGFAATLTGNGEPVQVKGGSVTVTFFSTLGVQPVRGRSFQPADEAADPPVVLLGYGFWQSRFGGSDSVLGTAVTLDGKPYTVIGVMPNGVHPAWPANGPRVYFQPEYQEVWRIYPKAYLAYRASHVMGVVARLRPAVTVAVAQKQMDVIAARLEKTYPENKDEGALVRPLMDEVAGSARPALLILLAAVGAVLLVACSNVGGLLLARLTARRHEIAVRCALGAGRAALVRQFLVEGLLLALLSAAAGIWLAYEGQRMLLRLVPPDIPRLADAGLDARVLSFTASVALLAAIFFALAPAWSAGRVNVSDALKETSRASESRRSLHLRDFLVVTQVSLAVILTVGATLLLQSFSRMTQVDPGFRRENLLIAEVGLSATKYTKLQRVASFYRQMLEQVRNAPGVTSAHLAYDHPLDSNWLTGFSIEGRPGEKTDSVQLKIVTPGYFAGMGQRLLQGREFEEQEDPSRRGVAIINEAFVRRYFPDGHALGKTILSDAAHYSWPGQVPRRFEIVGIANDIHRPGLVTRVDPFFYVCAWQFPRPEMNLLVRTAGDPAAIGTMLRKIASEIDPDLPIAKVTTMESVVSQAVAQPRLNTVLISIFGALGLLLTLVGVYGLVAFWVRARVREIGVRMALGATRASVLALVLRRGALLIMPGIVVGLAGALLLSHFLQTQLYGISAVDPLTYAIVPAAIMLVGLLACLIPAREATCVEPVVALRNE
jgi:putative ABC transport system permease protein